MFRNKQNQSGFTLMEVLVVIAIIGTLASVVLTTFTTVRKKARDARRIADIRQINSAIQIYLNEKSHAPYVGKYECNASNTDSTCNTINEINKDGWSLFQEDLSPYLPKLPTDPCGAACFEGPPNFFTYVYHPPAAIAAWCEKAGCKLPLSELNNQYSIFAQRMEVDSPLLNGYSNGVPTFGFKDHSLGESF